jgi:hypothetical protein
MTFNLETWKEKAGGRLHEMGAWLEGRKAQDAPYLLYGALCGASLWPLVQAAQAGQLLPAVMALGSVAAGVGGNLLAEQVQRWKDDADEAALAGWVAEHAPADPDLREALDAVLAQLEAVTQAQAALSEADRDWFAATLRGELAQLGNLARFEATLTGPGVIAQDHSVAATTGAVAVGRDVHGDVILVADPDRLWQAIRRRPPTQDLRRSTARYLAYLVDRHRYLYLKGMGVSDRVPLRLPLAEMYVPLKARVELPEGETWSRGLRLAGREIVWVKNNWSAGDLRGSFGNQYEEILFVVKGRHLLRGKRWSNVWHFDRVPANRMLHPTQKPVPLLMRAIQASSDPGDPVVDPFAGSGSTGTAAGETGRDWLMGDVDPRMVNIARERLGLPLLWGDGQDGSASGQTYRPEMPKPEEWGLHPEELRFLYDELWGNVTSVLA